MMQKNIFLCILLCLCSYGFGQFAADFSISNDPNVIGILTGAIYYDQTTTNMRLEYTLGVIELFNFTAQIRYLGCPTGLGTYNCDAETYKVPFPRFYVEGGDSPVAGQNYVSGGRTCTRYNKASQPAKGVSAVWVDGSGYPCRALFVGTTKQIDFTNIRGVGAPAYTQYRSWGCPQQQCDRMMDFILVFDESGSIDSTSFNQEKTFARTLAQSYTFGSYGVAMGLVMFSGSARRIIYPSVDQQSTINAINGVVQSRGSTCIPCGIDIARSDFATRGRAGATKIMIVLTDGENNVRDNDFYSVTAAAHNEGILCFAVGVAGYDLGQLNVIASTISGVTTVFTTPDFSQLQGLLVQLVSQTCIDIPGNPCGAGCNGFCSCHSVCLCPDKCNDSNACTQDLCTANANGNGCRYVPITCNDNDACTNDVCDINAGCIVGSQVNCDDGNPCTIDTCNKATGCSYLPTDCNDNNPCTQDLCSTGQGGCYHPPQSCNRCIYPVNVTCPKINCFTNECDPGTGNCTATAKVCNDGNACTNDLCNPLTGNCTTTAVVCNDNNACTHDFCDPITGCYTTPFDVPNECNDYSACTTDTCNPSTGCVHTPINCYDGDNCTSDTCNSALGCQFPVRVCANELNVGQCSVATCSQDRGCYLEPVPSLTLDCGLCALSGETCQDQDLDTNDIIGISSGVAAAIGLAVVAVVAVISGFSGKKLYDIYVKNKGNLHGAQMSPLYQDNGLSGTNPLFEHPQ